MIMDRIALVLAIIGGLNWGLVGIFRFDLVAYIFGGQTATISRVVYTLVGLAAIWCISLLFRESESAEEDMADSNHQRAGPGDGNQLRARERLHCRPLMTRQDRVSGQLNGAAVSCAACTWTARSIHPSAR